MQIKICIDNTESEFTVFEDAIHFLQKASVNEASSRLIKLLDNEAIKTWVKAHNNYLPLGYVMTCSSKGMSEVVEYSGEFEHFDESIFNIPKADIKELYSILSNDNFDTINDIFVAICNTYADDWPSVRCSAAKFNADFSSFELKEDSIPKDW